MNKNIVKFLIGKLFKAMIKIKNNIKSTQIGKFRFAIVIDMLIKTILFLLIIETDTADTIEGFSINIICIMAYLAFILFIYSFSYLISKNKQIVFYMIVSIGYSYLLIIDLWYFRVNKDIIGFKNIIHEGTFNPLGGCLYNFRPIDLLFIIDIIILLFYIIIKRIRNDEKKDIGKFWFSLKQSIILLLISFLIIDVFGLAGWDKRLFTKRWSTLMSVPGAGPLGYHGIEAVRSLSRLINGASEEEKANVNNWMMKNIEEIEINEYSGVLKSKNVIFLQIESLENFVINKKTNGKEITPFLNKLTQEGLYFKNFYQQNNAGNSIDCDLMVNTSVYPLGGDVITALNYGESVYKNSLPRIMESEGYTTISSHPESIGDFNWTELHKNGFGVQELWDITKYNYEETVGYGLSDRSFFTQISSKLKDMKEPFLFQAPTLSSHGPYDIDAKYRTLDLPKDVDESYLGGYFESVAYTDRQIEMFFNQLDKNGQLDDTVVVIYGDHAGVHKYYNDEIQKLDYEGNWWAEYDQKIPLIIYSKGLTAKVIEASGGQVDILPTISYLMGVDREKYNITSMGRVLVNTNRDATVIKGNKIIGNVKSDEEKDHLLTAYDIGEIIIKKNLFNER